MLLASTDWVYCQNIRARLVEVHDGDTFSAKIKGWPAVVGDAVGVRLYGYDAPEIHDHRADMAELAHKAKERLAQLLLTAPFILLTTVRRDKYFRLLCEVTVNKSNPVEKMVAEGLLRAYSGEGPKPW